MDTQIELTIKYAGTDNFCRPVYKHTNSRTYFGSIQTLLPNPKVSKNNIEKEINEYFKNNIKELEYFGNKFNCEPHGGIISKYKLIIID